MFNKRQYLYHGKRFAWCLFYILIFERRTSSVTLQVVGWLIAGAIPTYTLRTRKVPTQQ